MDVLEEVHKLLEMECEIFCVYEHEQISWEKSYSFHRILERVLDPQSVINHSLKLLARTVIQIPFYANSYSLIFI